MRLGIFTKPCHVEKIVNYLNQWTDITYVISTEKSEIDLYDYEIGISYCWPYKVKDTETKDWYNYHPGFLPVCRGIDCYTRAMLDGRYGVTLHKMNDEFDSGEIIEVREFEANPTNSQDLANITHYHLFQLFKDTVGGLADGSGE